MAHGRRNREEENDLTKRARNATGGWRQHDKQCSSHRPRQNTRTPNKEKFRCHLPKTILHLALLGCN